MDQICCLLGLCCPPAERLSSVTTWFASFGVERKAAAVVAEKLIAAIDAHPLGKLMQSLKHG